MEKDGLCCEASCEKITEKDKEAYMAFVDLEKAYMM